jgi:hypothetical protein
MGLKNSIQNKFKKPPEIRVVLLFFWIIVSNCNYPFFFWKSVMNSTSALADSIGRAL